MPAALHTPRQTVILLLAAALLSTTLSGCASFTGSQPSASGSPLAGTDNAVAETNDAGNLSGIASPGANPAEADSTISGQGLLARPKQTAPINPPAETAGFDKPDRTIGELSAPSHARNQFAVYDPAETTNRRIYKFNAKFDENVFLPVVFAYRSVTPDFVRKGVSNFFLNLGEIPTFTNSLLQAKVSKAAPTLGRFAINSTVGVLGLFDVATPLGIERRSEDFGQTLGTWGAGPGPYVVLPILGPSNVRDAVGTLVDTLTFAYIVPDGVADTTAYDVVQYGLRPIDTRYNTNFRYYVTGSPFEYELVRYVTTESRRVQIAK